MFDDLKTIFNETVNESNSNTKNESKSDNENKNESVNENKNESENESENENESNDGQYYLKQIIILKRLMKQNHQSNLRLFKLKLAHIFNGVDDNLFKKIFDFTSVELADELINVTSKNDNQIIIDHIEIKRDKIYEDK